MATEKVAGGEECGGRAKHRDRPKPRTAGRYFCRRTVNSATSGGRGGAFAPRNPVPRTLARVVPANIRSSTLGAPGATDVFVTDAAALRGLNAKEIAAKLTIPESASGFRVIEFPSAGISGIASPVNRPTQDSSAVAGRQAGFRSL